MMISKWLLFLFGVLLLPSSHATFAQEDAHAATRKWRSEREEKLKAPRGWLSVAGLFWLKEGENKVGSAPGNDVLLPASSAPGTVGVIELRSGKTIFRVAEGAAVLVNDRPITDAELKTDETKTPDFARIGELTLGVIKRGERFGVRLWDPRSKYQREFTGLKWYEVNDEHRVKAKLIAFPRPENIPIANVLGGVDQMPSPGMLVFKLNGREHRLQPVIDADGSQLFILFRDATSGKTTYGAGRFLYADFPQNGEVTLDFNRAFNPPCTFTAYATCPLPPRQNRLSVAIEAGELNYHADDAGRSN